MISPSLSRGWMDTKGLWREESEKHAKIFCAAIRWCSTMKIKLYKFTHTTMHVLLLFQASLRNKKTHKWSGLKVKHCLHTPEAEAHLRVYDTFEDVLMSFFTHGESWSNLYNPSFIKTEINRINKTSPRRGFGTEVVLRLKWIFCIQ